MKAIKLALIVLIAIGSVSCTNNRWFLSTLYNRVDNTAYSDAVKYADFSDEQRDQIRSVVKKFHHWHRTTQLPLYAKFLERLSERANSNEPVKVEEIEQWSEQIRGFVHTMNDCHPMISGIDIMIGLTDEQVEQIAEHSNREYEKYLKRYHKKKPEERMESRYRKTLKWFNRFQLDIDHSESQFLKETMEIEPKLRESSFELWAAWDKRFYELLLMRSEETFPDLMKAHILSLKTMLEDSYPDEMAYKLDLWVQFFHEIAQSELNEQNSEFPEWASHMSDNLQAISQSVPSNQHDWDAKDYCEAGA